MASPQFSAAKKISPLLNQVQKRRLLLLRLLRHFQNSHTRDTEIPTILKECGKVAAIHEGKQTHCMILKHGFHSDTILMTSLLDMYSKCTRIDEAIRVFDEMPEPDIVATNSMISGLCRCQFISDAMGLFDNMPLRDVTSWNSIISGLGQNSNGRASMFYFELMRVEGVEVDFFTVLSVLSVCSDLAALVSGKKIHGLVIKFGFESFLPVGNAVIDMYAKSGRMDDACLCFKNMRFKNVVSWTSLIVGYGKHGLGSKAIQAFIQMEKERIVPNNITFVGMLYACSHSGLVREGWMIYNTMIHQYGIVPMLEHYTTMVDLLARAGRLEDAHKFIQTLPMQPDARLLTAFLSACCSHKNSELVKTVGQKLLELKPDEAGAYMLLSNFYGLDGDLEGVSKVRKLMLDNGIRKEKAYTLIEINRTVHRFESGDKSHPEAKSIYCYLETLFEKMRRNGYVPNTSMVMQNVEEHLKEEIVMFHSEKLAVAFGLISTPNATAITIVKNLRVCVDCHVVIGLVSKIEKREIVMRDSNRFHHFKDGLCSCQNHW